MLGGFTIATGYGDIDISDPDECRAVAAVVRALLERRLVDIDNLQHPDGEPDDADR